MSIELDQDGWSDAVRLLDQTLTALEQIHTDSKARASGRQPGQPMIDAQVALLLFRRRP